MASSFQGYELFICKRSKGAPNKGGLSGGPRGGLGFVQHQTKGTKVSSFLYLLPFLGGNRRSFRMS